MTEEKYCQSCGMPMSDSAEIWGNEKDGSKSRDYCVYCYKDGEFTADVNMDEMIEICVPHMAEHGGFTEEKARNMMKEFFPRLKRWRKQ